MTMLNVFDNDFLYHAAQTLLVVTGSMIVGVAISYVYYVQLKRELGDARAERTSLQQEVESLRGQVQDAMTNQHTAEAGLEEAREKITRQSRIIQDQASSLQAAGESRQRSHPAELEELHARLETFRARMAVIEAELVKAQQPYPEEIIPSDSAATAPVVAEASELLGRPVMPDDLMIIDGITPDFADALHHQGIRTWDALGASSAEALRELMAGAGYVSSADPSSWPDQARMAARGEWRKLRLFQVYIRSAGYSQPPGPA